jgi:hypothetical protein
VKLNDLLQRLEAIRQEHGDLDVYIGFPDFPGEGRVDGELDEVEFESYDPNNPSDKGLMLWSHAPALLEREQPAEPGPSPEEQATELEVLSLNWMTLVHLSRAYRAAGHDIDRKMEAECGFVLQRLLGLARKHGTNWREHAATELKEMLAATAPTGEVVP